MENNVIELNKNTYSINNKKYKLVEEVVKGGCQGCAFLNTRDMLMCNKLGLNKICNREHKIFMRNYKKED